MWSAMRAIGWSHIASPLLLLFIAGAGMMLALTLPPESAQYLPPVLASSLIVVVFAFMLRRRVGDNIFGELGFLYVGFAAVYAIMPALGFMVSGLDEGGQLGRLLPEALELKKHLWRLVLFQFGVVVGYLLIRGRSSSQVIAIGRNRSRDDYAILFVAVMIAVCVASVVLLSAPVETYYDHYVRYDHLSWSVRKFVSVCLRLSLGLYCVLLVFLFRNYPKYRFVIPVVVAAICIHEITYSHGARIQALIVLLQAVCLYHFMVKRISLKVGLVACAAMAVLFSAVELVRVMNFDLASAKGVLSEEGLKPASEFVLSFFASFHLYAERAQGSLPPRELPMFFWDFISLVTFGDFTRWNPMYWYAENYFPFSEVPPFTLGPVADSAIWGGEVDLALRSLINGAFFAYIMRLFLRYRDEWWAMTIYVYCYATCILALKYSVFFHLNPIVKNLVPTLLIVFLVRTLRLVEEPGLMPHFK